jgi:S1-C subfamily serine protease
MESMAIKAKIPTFFFLAAMSGCAEIQHSDITRDARSIASSQEQHGGSFTTVRSNVGGQFFRGSAVSVERGVAVTNSHVVGYGRNIFSIELQRGDGGKTQAELLGISREIDIAVLRIPDDFLNPAEVRDTPPEILESVLITGSVERGVRAAPGHIARGVSNIIPYGDVFTVSADVAQGFSGGSVQDSNGRLLGITAARSDGFGYAIPISKIMPEVGAILSRRRRALAAVGSNLSPPDLNVSEAPVAASASQRLRQP